MTPAVPALIAAAVGAGVLVGCTADPTPVPDPSGSVSPPTLDPDAAALVAAHAREVALLATYADPLTVTPGLTPAADEARVHHVLHLRAIEALMREPALVVATSASPSAAASATPAPSAPDAVALARSLLAAERTAADAGIVAVGSGVASAIRRLLAEIAASEAQHATALYIALREGTIRRAPAARPAPTASP